MTLLMDYIQYFLNQVYALKALLENILEMLANILAMLANIVDLLYIEDFPRMKDWPENMLEKLENILEMMENNLDLPANILKI